MKSCSGIRAMRTNVLTDYLFADISRRHTSLVDRHFEYSEDKKKNHVTVGS